MSKKPKGKLTVREELFCHEYLVDLKPGDAYERAGYSPNGRLRAAKILLREPIVQTRIEALRGKQLANIGIQAEDVLCELLTIARVDITEAFDPETHTLKPLGDIPASVRRTIASIDVFEEFQGTGERRKLIGFTKRVKFLDKIKSLELLGKHLSLFKEVHEHRIEGELAEMMIEARDRREERRREREERTVEGTAIIEADEPDPLPETGPQRPPAPVDDEGNELVLNPNRPQGFIKGNELEQLRGCPKCFTQFDGSMCPRCNQEMVRHGT